MQRNENKNATENGVFISMTRHQKHARTISENKIETSVKKNGSIKTSVHTILRKAEDMPESYRKLLARTAVCAILALGIWGIKSMDSGITNQVSEGIKNATSGETEIDEDLGGLKFVNGEEVTETSGYSLPLEGEIIESFSDTEKNVKIQSEANANVKAILAGTIIEVTQEKIVIENENGTQTTYTGLIPSVTAGDKVKNADVIGQLSGEVLCLETVSGIGYVDSLDAAGLNETGD